MDHDALHRAMVVQKALAPISDKDTDAGRIERVRYALAGFDLPDGCTHVAMGLHRRPEDCPECAELFLRVVMSIMHGQGLPDEAGWFDADGEGCSQE